MDCFKKVLKYNAIALGIVIGVPSYIIGAIWLALQIRDWLVWPGPMGALIWMGIVAMTAATVVAIIQCGWDRKFKR